MSPPGGQPEGFRRVFRLTRWRLSPLTWRILAVNLLAPALLVMGSLFLDTYEQGLLRSEHESLREHAEMIAAAVAEGAVSSSPTEERPPALPYVQPQERLHAYRLLPEQARHMVRRLSAHSGRRVRLYDRLGNLIADSRYLFVSGGEVEVVDLPPVPPTGFWPRMLVRFNALVIQPIGQITSESRRLPLYQEFPIAPLTSYDDLAQALTTGEPAEATRTTEGGTFVITVAVPVQYYKQVVGAIFMASSTEDVDADLFQVRMAILQLFLATLAVTVLVSFYQAGTIARPIRMLAQAATLVQGGHRAEIPDLSNRADEIGELSAALRQMTAALWGRITATERFAADVAHELKNPLTSLRSAVETAAKIDDPAMRSRLWAVIGNDVQRMNRLISDISDMSRVDGELLKTEAQPLNLGAMLSALVEVESLSLAEGGPRLVLDVPPGESLWVRGLEGRVVQVLRNLIRNAVTFSPPGGAITLRAYAGQGSFSDHVVVEVDDEGPGIPEGKERTIFDRFYSERPAGEKFGSHSGLGLAISKQIIEGMGGTIDAVNRRDVEGEGTPGARFVIVLPRIPAPAAE